MSTAQRKLIALALAGLYALFSCAGQGLHSLAHLACEVTEETTCSCGEGNCIFAQREAEESLPSTEETSFAEGNAPGHNPHECGVCQLLSQLRMASGGGGAAPHFAEKVVEPTCVAEPLFSAVTPHVYYARGPPSEG